MCCRKAVRVRIIGVTFPAVECERFPGNLCTESGKNVHRCVSRFEENVIHILCKNIVQHTFQQKGSLVLSAQSARDRDTAHVPLPALAVDGRCADEFAVLLHAPPLRLLIRRNEVQLLRNILLVRENLRGKSENRIHVRIRRTPNHTFCLHSAHLPYILQKRRKDAPSAFFPHYN